MKDRVLHYLLHGLLWLLVGTSLFIAAERAQNHRSLRTIHSLKIEIADSSSHGQLVTREQVEEWLSGSPLKLHGSLASQVDLDAIEELIARNGFVGEVSASVSYGGELQITIHQRKPLFRLLTEGYNHYVTEEGYIFRAPQRSSIYVPVVTGSYPPPFEKEFEGLLSDHEKLSEEESERRIATLEIEKYPFFKREQKNMEYHRETRRMFIKQGLLESDEHFEKRVNDLRALKKQRRRHYRYEQQQIAIGIDRVNARQEAEQATQKKLRKKYQDFQNLITFVKKIDEDAFWRSEIVQIITSRAHSGALEVEFIPRSGAFTVAIGRLEACEEKLERLERFSDEGLGRLGWSRFRRIDLRCPGRVICTER